LSGVLVSERSGYMISGIHATLALEAGVPVKVVSERLGHESPAFTLKQCAHVIPGMQAAAGAVVAELIRSQAAQDRNGA
jgi:hypothetical protein